MKHSIEAHTLLEKWVHFAPNWLHEDEKSAWVKEGEKLLRHWQFFLRAYHNLSHLSAMVQHLSSSSLTEYDNPDALLFGIFFHDAVYKAWRNDNEEKSAEWAVKTLHRFRFNDEFIKTVEQLILITKTHKPEERADHYHMLDIDLSILGSDWETYSIYEKNIRKEYFFVSPTKYKEGRTKVLKSFLQRPKIYHIEKYALRFEAQARLNLEKAITLL